jgi:L-ornithine Nalpha-acyltransferase
MPVVCTGVLRQQRHMLIDVLRTPLARLADPAFFHPILRQSAKDIAGLRPFLDQGYGFRSGGRHARSLAGVLGRSGSLEVRFAHNARDLRRAQRLRYRVFYEEMSAAPSHAARLTRLDADRFDALCDHLLVIDHEATGRFGGRRPQIVGTYRLLRQDVAARHGGFYTQGEFDIGPLLARHPQSRFLELGRSCVLEPYRNKKTVELLWHGIWAYVRHHRIDVMFGCASLDGTDPAALALPLAFLQQTSTALEPWRVAAHPARRIDISAESLATLRLDPKAALRSLPPLIKGYLRVGARFGEGAVVDHQFGTTDVLVILPVACLDPRYISYYGAAGERYAA